MRGSEAPQVRGAPEKPPRARLSPGVLRAAGRKRGIHAVLCCSTQEVSSNAPLIGVPSRSRLIREFMYLVLPCCKVAYFNRPSVTVAASRRA